MTDFASLPGAVREALYDEPVPDWRSPTLATLTDDRFSDPGWIFERKFDGMRCLAFRDGDRVRLLSRNRQPLNGTYPELVDALAAQPVTRFVVDGEVVAFDGRRTSFARLQGRLGLTDPDVARASPVRVFYYVFDLLHLDGMSTVEVPLLWRKRLLRKAIDFADPLRCAPHRVGDGIAAYRRACERGDEGVIAKRADSTYQGGRSKNWLKFKCVRDQEFVVGGYTSPKGSRVELGALMLGYYDGGDLVYAGKVGTGFDDATLRRLHARLSPITRDRPPFARGLVREAGANWVSPEMVVQIGFSEWTRDGKLRHPRYLGMRTDKEPGEVVRETH
ncbi:MULTISPECIES: non-homologous end-joining DNA ligase [Mycobacterium]|uniref:DNA ligase (ATP) n=2 Tax=Mycobacterium avium complex (MAC) TaxID=120793 RepID=X8CFR3_MYCIT|nr:MULTISPECIES: non-homologous end-joining DNA ligase [Mycobacterium]EUA54934.1 ATP-dependent DNA ligase [Mycobacterium intracellulare 1956]AFC49352.1 DNA polymerase LigD ligase subunit [Mycobacterium intracellulare MOTT-02]AFC54567.1 DNA polymerase LigD ligase subunit [Mycobacterium paraintracellulare]AFJ35931.1 DNA polymerase LigD ligase subunit [Mycobacterium sp. MOTT36Y]ASW86063.1 ATP-dependent DNA ligase [Mycobacterium intracellulare]